MGLFKMTLRPDIDFPSVKFVSMLPLSDVYSSIEVKKKRKRGSKREGDREQNVWRAELHTFIVEVPLSLQ